jgi:hypothetical protein
MPKKNYAKEQWSPRRGECANCEEFIMKGQMCFVLYRRRVKVTHLYCCKECIWMKYGEEGWPQPDFIEFGED